MNYKSAFVAKRTIVICDDNDDILEIFGMTLRNDGYNVGTAHNFNELRPLLKTLNPDLLILDIQIPDELDGFDIIEEIRRLGLALPIMLVTAHDHFMYRLYAPISGVRDFLTKPVDPEVLLQKIKLVLTEPAARP